MFLSVIPSFVIFASAVSSVRRPDSFGLLTVPLTLSHYAKVAVWPATLAAQYYGAFEPASGPTERRAHRLRAGAGPPALQLTGR